jgi:uncharacterized iron-regulated protein
MNNIFYSFFITFILLFSPVFIYAYEDGGGVIHENDLEVRIDVKNSAIKGVSRITVRSGHELLLNKGSLEISGMTLNGRKIRFREYRGGIKLTPDEDGVIEIRFRGVFRDQYVVYDRKDETIRDIISKQGISLTGVWYPQIEGLTIYRLTAVLPEGYEAVSEAEVVKKTVRNGESEFSFSFPYPLDGISLVASDRYQIIEDSLGDVDIIAYFFPEDAGLAGTYIEFTRKYLELYEKLIGRFPYRRFLIVENFLPTGYSMATFTLLGSTVVRLPFIVETSLGHEILHQWFGNHVYIDYGKGNWAEGLTTYLADHLYKEQEGKGWEYRKQMLMSYGSYVKPENEFALEDFRVGLDRASRAIGYNKTAMVFHMLKNMAGEENFFLALRDLVETKRFSAASWEDIQASFEKIYNNDLSWFFDQWVHEKGMPDISLEDVEFEYVDGNFKLHFHIKQGGTVYRMDVPVTIYRNGRPMKRFFTIRERDNPFYVFLSESPGRIVVDEDYDVARKLTKEEFPPVVSRLLGEDDVIIAAGPDSKKVYGGIIDELKNKKARVERPEDIGHSDIGYSSVIILGLDNPLIERFFGKVFTDDAGFTVVMKRNPWNPEKVVGIMHGKSRKEVDAAYRKISRYGKYSFLVFENGRNIKSEIEETERGIGAELRETPPAVDISSINDLNDVIENVAGRKVIYVGEIHDVFAHHAVQLDIIMGIYRKNSNISIGMEMFQRPFQDTLDDFIEGRMEEKEFLKKSEYFTRWGFDYNLYKPILDFARTRKIPVVALNIKREIIKGVSKGGLDLLDDEEKKDVPPEMDFSDLDYRERLKETFRLHKNLKDRNFDFFYQSQILWDESMSWSIDRFLEENPGYKMIVLAGQGHLKYGSGIPKRTYRRNGHEYAVVLIDAKVEKGVADYVIFPTPVEGITSPKLMVFLGEEDGQFKIVGFPEESVSEEAGLKIGDIILAIDGFYVKNLDDMKIQLLYKKQGEKVSVKILRKKLQQENIMTFDVTL